MAELSRGKTGRVYGNYISIATMMKGLPLSYNRDMQEDKEAYLKEMDELHPIGRVGMPKEGEFSVLMVASDEASLITGANIPVDGGFTAV